MKLLSPDLGFGRNPLLAWRNRWEGVYTWGNLAITFFLLLFLVGGGMRFSVYLDFLQILDFAPPEQRHDLKISNFAVLNEPLGPAPAVGRSRGGINLQVLAILGLLTLHLLESFRVMWRRTSRWDNPEGDSMRLLPVGWRERYFALQDWPRFKTSLALLFCALLLAIMPSLLVSLWPANDIIPLTYAMRVIYSALLVSGAYFLSLLTMGVLACLWLLHWLGILSRERGLAVLIDPSFFTTVVVSTTCTLYFRKLLFFPAGGSGIPGRPELTWGLQLYGGVFATMVVAWVLAAWAKHRYFRLVEKRLAGDG